MTRRKERKLSGRVHTAKETREETERDLPAALPFKATRPAKIHVKAGGVRGSREREEVQVVRSSQVIMETEIIGSQLRFRPRLLNFFS